MTKNWLSDEDQVEHLRKLLRGGIHVGVKDGTEDFVCICGQPWPCDGAKPPKGKLRKQ